MAYATMNTRDEGGLERPIDTERGRYCVRWHYEREVIPGGGFRDTKEISIWIDVASCSLCLSTSEALLLHQRLGQVLAQVNAMRAAAAAASEPEVP